MDHSVPLSLSYDNIQIVAEEFARKYQVEHPLPQLPTETDLLSYKNILETEFSGVIKLVKQRLAEVESEGGHGYEHLEWVACFAGYIAQLECTHRQLADDLTKSYIRRAMLAGFLHNIERHLGFGDDYMQKGAETARRFLEQLHMMDESVIEVIRNHDRIEFDTRGDRDLEIIFGCVFDADHSRYGLERADTFWRMKEKQGKSPEATIHDYAYLPQYRKAWRTYWGQQIGPALIDYGLAIAKHVEEVFTSKPSTNTHY